MSKLLSTFNAELHVTKEGGAILKDLAHGRSLYFQPGYDANSILKEAESILKLPEYRQPGAFLQLCSDYAELMEASNG